MMDKSITMRGIKGFALVMLRDVKKVKTVMRILGIKFDEPNFTIRFDINSISNCGENLSIGDVCKLYPDFYRQLNRLDGLPIEIRRRLPEKYVIIAFVEANGPHYHDIFCILAVSDNSNDSSLPIEKEEDRVLLFWP
ncbi:MAG TPA: hypothetical protein VMC41_00230, partial [Candidatus Nanoarchaeia archaeon]|nr:hypothetical protein [Candidatus Nanoarchaeia archaeon]